MLTLLTHEQNFIIFREEIRFRKKERVGVSRGDMFKHQRFEILYLNLLREYFSLDFAPLEKKMSFNISMVEFELLLNVIDLKLKYIE